MKTVTEGPDLTALRRDADLLVLCAQGLNADPSQQAAEEQLEIQLKLADENLKLVKQAIAAWPEERK